jgi:alkylated DNA repair dioxygenase AlkB
MQTITILSPQESAELLNWCKAQTLEQEIFTGRPTCRLKKWWGYEAEFYFNKSHVEKRSPIDDDAYLAYLVNRFRPQADSILLYKYDIGGEIGEHLDKQCFNKWVTLINITDSADLFGNHEATKFKWNKHNYILKHGEVVYFDSRVPHSIPKVKCVRYSLQFRNIQW